MAHDPRSANHLAAMWEARARMTERGEMQRIHDMRMRAEVPVRYDPPPPVQPLSEPVSDDKLAQYYHRANARASAGDELSAFEMLKLRVQLQDAGQGSVYSDIFDEWAPRNLLPTDYSSRRRRD